MCESERKRSSNDEFVNIAPLTGRSIWSLKSWAPESTAAQHPVTVAGQELPCAVGATAPGAMRVLCLGSREWLIIATSTLDDNVQKIIALALSDQGISLVDLTDGLTGFGIQGTRARDLLSKGCSLDFHAVAFPKGTCARTRFAQVPAVIDRLEGPARFEVYVARSHGDYLGAWLNDAAAEWG